jgi:hypothetical protein
VILSKGGFDLSLLRKVFFIDWIPAFAGMTAADNALLVNKNATRFYSGRIVKTFAQRSERN